MMARFLVCLALVVCVAAGPVAAGPAADPQAMAKVTAGRRIEVRGPGAAVDLGGAKIDLQVRPAAK